MKRDDEDDKEGTEDDAGALQDQIDLLTQRLAKVKDADDSMILSLLVQTVKTRCKTILQRHRRCVTRITHHDKSKTHHQSWMVIKIVKEMQKRTTFPGSVCSGNHGQGTPKFCAR